MNRLTDCDIECNRIPFHGLKKTIKQSESLHTELTVWLSRKGKTIETVMLGVGEDRIGRAHGTGHSETIHLQNS